MVGKEEFSENLNWNDDLVAGKVLNERKSNGLTPRVVDTFSVSEYVVSSAARIIFRSRTALRVSMSPHAEQAGFSVLRCVRSMERAFRAVTASFWTGMMRAMGWP